MIMFDRDTLNAEIECKIVDTSPANYDSAFQASSKKVSGSPNEYTCTIRQVEVLSQSELSSLLLIVEAAQINDRKTEYATVFVTVEPAIDLAQNECDGPDIIEIEFPEMDPEITIDPKTLNVTRKILDGNPAEVVITYDELDGTKLPFGYSEKFTTITTSAGVFVQMKEGIDREVFNYVLQFTIKCLATVGSAARYTILKIQMADVNDNPPKFEQQFFRTDLSESAYSQTRIWRALVTDLDIGINSMIYYSLARAPNAQFDGTAYFHVGNDGSLNLVKALDFESMYAEANGDKSSVMYELLVIATDRGEPPLSSTATVEIRILDVDDLGPTFYYPSCISNGEQFGKYCMKAEYTTTVSTKTTDLVLFPLPVDDTSPNQPVDMIMFDRDTLNAEIECKIAGTSPAKYESAFQASSKKVSGSPNEYTCTIRQMEVFPQSELSSIRLIVEAAQIRGRVQGRVYATVYVTLQPAVDSGRYCPHNQGFLYPDKDCNGYQSCNSGVYTQHKCRGDKVFSQVVGACVEYKSFLDTCSSQLP